ncbi:MAG: hypothetical protein U0269_26915 [Polyangiales bacterium]
MTKTLSIHLEAVSSPHDVLRSFRQFALDCSSSSRDELLRDMIRRTQFILFDPTTGDFAPSMFCGFRQMSLALYQTAREVPKSKSTGAKFDGSVAQQAISAALDQTWAPDPSLSKRFADWAEKRWGKNILTGLDRHKWKFISLPPTTGGLASLAGGWEDSEELVSMTLAFRRSRGRGAPTME